MNAPLPEQGEIRRSPSDPLLASLDSQCFAAPWGAGDYRKLRKSAAVHAWSVETANGAPAGWLLFMWADGEAEIYRMGIVPSFRRAGWAYFLLNEFVAAARREGVERIFLEVRWGNRAARHLYEKVGFTLHGRRVGYFENPREDAAVYELRL